VFNAEHAKLLRDTIKALRQPQTDVLKIAREAAIEECASKVEDYPSPLDDLPMAIAMRNVAAAIRRLKEQSK
jgi:hypothetical protein